MEIQAMASAREDLARCRSIQPDPWLAVPAPAAIVGSSNITGWAEEDRSMTRFAMVDADGNVTDVLEWDGNTDPVTGGWQPPDGMTMIEDPDGLASPGGSYVDGEFKPAPEPKL